jgi:hypothetical protein
MSVETATKIKDLNPSWPTGTDSVSEGDDHIRLIKQVLQDEFSGGMKGLRLAIKIPDYSSRPGANWATVSDTSKVPDIGSASQAIVIEVAFEASTTGYGITEGMYMRLINPDGDALTDGTRILGWNHNENTQGFNRGSVVAVTYRSIFTPAELVDGEFKVQVKEHTSDTSGGVGMFNTTVTASELA